MNHSDRAFTPHTFHPRIPTSHLSTMHTSHYTGILASHLLSMHSNLTPHGHPDLTPPIDAFTSHTSRATSFHTSDSYIPTSHPPDLQDCDTSHLNLGHKGSVTHFPCVSPHFHSSQQFWCLRYSQPSRMPIGLSLDGVTSGTLGWIQTVRCDAQCVNQDHGSPVTKNHPLPSDLLSIRLIHHGILLLRESNCCIGKFMNAYAGLPGTYSHHSRLPNCPMCYVRGVNTSSQLT